MGSEECTVAELTMRCRCSAVRGAAGLSERGGCGCGGGGGCSVEDMVDGCELGLRCAQIEQAFDSGDDGGRARAQLPPQDQSTY